MEEKKPLICLNGVYDVLHSGHLALLKRAVELKIERNGTLVVLINSDESVKRLKGNNRPINSLWQRKMQLLNYYGVDQVHDFNEDTPVESLKRLAPDYLIVTEDHLQGPEMALVDQGIIKVAILVNVDQFVDGKKWSSSLLIDRIRANKPVFKSDKEFFEHELKESENE
jgi:D-beta-D-heptose 7-phosphate kinase / D-beta-D-heptose 1-phosphate adenosyltransferase